MALTVLVYALAGVSAQSSAYFCGEYGRDGLCATCYGSFRGADGLCYPPALAIPQCLLYSSAELCAICAYGYGLRNNHCIPLQSNDYCRVYGPDGACLMCERHTMLTRGGCDPRESCSAISRCSHCARGSSVTGCVRCDTGYTVQLDRKTGLTRCVPSHRYLRNCWASFDGRMCTACDVNYYASSGACIYSPVYHFDIDWYALPA